MKFHYDGEPTVVPEDALQKVEISLRELREAKGLNIRDVSRAIKISPSIIEAIEKEAFDQLPEAVYTRTFIKNYAEILGGDYRPLLLRYDSYSQRTGQARREELREAAEAETPSWFRARRVQIILCVSFTLLIAIYFYLRQPEGGVGDKVASRETVSSQAVPKPSGTQPVSPVSQPAVVPSSPAVDAKPPSAAIPTPAMPKKGTHQILVSATAWTWLKMVIDKDPPFEVLLKPGESLMRGDFQIVTMTVGNAAVVTVTFDGKKVQMPDSSGETVTMTFPKAAKAVKKRPR